MKQKKTKSPEKMMELLAGAAGEMAKTLYAAACGEGSSAEIKNLKDMCGAVKELAAVVKSLEGKEAPQAEEITVRFLGGEDFCG